MPWRSGRLTSSRSRSKGCSSSLVRPASPVSALSTPYPSERSRSSSPSRISASSSTTRMAPLDMDLFSEDGELETEGSAFAGRGAHIDLSGVLLDDAVADRKSQPGAAAGRLGGKERIENADQVFAGDAHPGIGDLNLDVAVLRRRAHLEHSARRHGVARVHEQVQEDLLQAVRRAQH